MKLQDILDQLTSGELSQLSIGGQEAGVIDQSNLAKVLPHINLALTTLFKRFRLKEGRLTLGLVADRTVYPLKSSYAQSNTRSREPVKFIQDSAAAPFKDDIVKIERVLTADGLDLALNDTDDELSVLTTTATTLQVPLTIVNQDVDLPESLQGSTSLQVVYRADAPKLAIPVTPADLARFPFGYDPVLVEVELPYTHLEALLYFVASRVTSPMGTGQFEGVAGNNWYARFEAACQDLESRGLQEQRNAGFDKLHDRGFV